MTDLRFVGWYDFYSPRKEQKERIFQATDYKNVILLDQVHTKK